MSKRMYLPVGIAIAAIVVMLGAVFGQRLIGEPDAARADSPAVLAPGETLTLEDGALLRFVGVVRDSRCPMDVICVRAGEAVIEFEIEPAGGSTEAFTIELGTAGPAQLEVGGYTVEVRELQPYPKASEPAAPEDFRVTVVVDAA